jgi:cystathionine beta-synthase
MSPEKVAVLRALNAEIIRTPTAAAYDSPESHIGVAKRLLEEIPNSHILDQYGNPNNPLAHEFGTGEEIWQQTNGQVKLLVAGAGTGGTITGIARGLHKHNRDIKIAAADPQGSVLALPATLNDEHANESYKVEGIGYDFIPDVLDQKVIDKWYKTEDRESFHFSRRLIAEEGLLVGGSSGSAMAAMVRAVKDFDLKKGDVVVVVLPDSIRSYLSKFIDDDWLAANDLLPPTPPETPAEPISPTLKARDPFQGATIASLRLKPVTSISTESPCAEAIETMRDKGFDQLPVSSTSNRLVGLVTLGNLLSYIGSGRAHPDDPVKNVMFNFSKLNEVVTDPQDISKLSLQATENPKEVSKGKNRKFVEITKNTPLSALSRFFEWNSAAVVTEEDSNGGLKAIAVVTKVDLLSWMVRQKKNQSGV